MLNSKKVKNSIIYDIHDIYKQYKFCNEHTLKRPYGKLGCDKKNISATFLTLASTIAIGKT